jgi:hypothetical protein
VAPLIGATLAGLLSAWLHEDRAVRVAARESQGLPSPA